MSSKSLRWNWRLSRLRKWSVWGAAGLIISHSTRTKPEDRPTTTGLRRPSSITQYKTVSKCPTPNVRLHPLAILILPCLTHNASKCQRAPRILRTLRTITARRWATIVTSAQNCKSQEKARPIRHCHSANRPFSIWQPPTPPDHCQDLGKPLVWEYYGNAG